MTAGRAPLRVLVAEDQKVVRDGLVALLRMLPGIEVAGAAVDGAGAAGGGGGGGGAAAGLGFGTRSGSHAAIASAGVQNPVR